MASAARRGTRSLQRCATWFVALVAVLALSVSGAAADSITPNPASLSLAAGSSTTIHQTIQLDALPPKADILLALDATGSMGTALAEARTDANAMVSQIQAQIPQARFAVANFKDYPFSPFGLAAENGFGLPADYPWQLNQDFTDNSGTVSCPLIDPVPLSPIECALNGFNAPPGSGGDNPESYNRAFYEAYHDPALNWASGSPRFMVVLGDALPHDSTQNTDFPGCPNTGPTDPGPDNASGTSDDLRTQPTLTALRQANTNLSFVTYNPAGISWGAGFTTAGCQKQLAEYTGGQQVTRDSGAGASSLATQIVSLIKAAAANVDSVTFNVTSPDVENANSWFTFTPPALGPLVAPQTVPYDMTVTVPQTAALGIYHFTVHAVGDGAERATQDVTVTVGQQNVSALAMTVDEPSIPAGIASVPYGVIPGSRLPNLTADVQSAAAGSIPAGSIAAGSIPAGSIAAGSIAAGSIAAGSIAAGSIPAGSIGLSSTAAGSIPAGSIAAGSIPANGAALKSVLLSQVPLVGTTWATILASSQFANQPLQAVTLYDLANYDAQNPTGTDTPWQRLLALPLRQVPFFQSLWRSVPFGALLLGNAPLDTLPRPLTKRTDDDPTLRYATWADAVNDNGGDTTGVDPTTNTVFGLAVSGNLGSTAVGSIAAGSIAAGSIAAGSIAAGSIAAGSIAAGSIDFRATTLGVAPLSLLTTTQLSALINCGAGFSCTGKTLGDASAANALKAGVTLADVLNAFPAPYNKLTIDSLAQGILAVSEYPWEQINVQGLQDIAGTGQNVHYHVDFDLVCSRATSFSLRVKLPKGFFPAAGTSQFSYAGGAPIAAANPTVGADGPVWSTIPGNPCNGGTATRHVRLNFTSFAGLTLGSQTSDAEVTAGGTLSSATGQAPVVVTQNGEPNDNPATTPAIEKNTLVVGHVASSADVDFHRFAVTGLAPGTKVTVYLKVPRDADLDLVVNRPGAPGVQSSAAGSIPAGSIAAGSIAAGSIPLEDSLPGTDNTRNALQPDTVADLAAGSIPAGSIAAGSISANRGAVNEAAQIVTRGEIGTAVIGVSGYNGASSNENYVLRVKVTPPPTLPACAPVLGLGTATPGSLPGVPGTIDTSVKTLFLVNRQRLAGLYGAAGADAVVGTSTPLNAVAGDITRVGGKILPVDGDPNVRAAYANWDQNQCSIDAANGVVRSINALVATYRPKYPNLRYVVLLGTDTALPSWRQQDLTATSPEVDEANDLAFTTSGLTKGNAIYAAAAQNAYLTDQAYGAFKERVWLGHDIPLADVSVSRLVETPGDINGQLQQYLDSFGHLTLQSATTTGDEFFADGAEKASTALAQQLGLATTSQTVLTGAWNHQDLLDNFFKKSTAVPDVGAIWAHYSHWLAQPATLPASPTLADLATSADIDPANYSYNGRLIFTVGCHSGLNVPDTLAAVASGDQQRLRDWAQAYMNAKAAVYVANTGFGYGDTTTIDLSERLMDHFAGTIKSGGTIGEQWVRALHKYYSEPSNYDVIDEKVMVEANMYGLPFYDFGTGTPPSPETPPTVPAGSPDSFQLPTITANVLGQPVDGGRSLFVDSGHPDGTTYTQGGATLTAGTLSVFYRPAQPTVSRDVTIDDPNKVAHGAWISGMTTHTIPNVKPVKPFPLVFSDTDRPAKEYPNIFFPANVVTVNRDFFFGKEHDTAVVNLGKFFPNATGELGTEQVVDSIGLQIGYSDSSDVTAPLITQVGAVKAGDGFDAFVRTDATGIARVAVMWAAPGSGAWTVTPLTDAGGGLWRAHIVSSAPSITLDAEAEDVNHNVGYSFNKAVHFQSFTDSGGPSITLDRPLPNALFTLNDQVASSFRCSDPGGVKSCLGQSDSGVPAPSGGLINTGSLGAHTFTVTSTDITGNVTTKTIPYFVVGIFGFKPPVDNPPIVNIVTAGNTSPVKWSLKDAGGNFVRSLGSVTSVTSSAIKCDTATTDPDPDTVQSGLAGLKYDLAGEQFVYNWQTQKSWKGTCRRLFVGVTGNGVLPFADFKFK
jgi:hypothetical protein